MSAYASYQAYSSTNGGGSSGAGWNTGGASQAAGENSPSSSSASPSSKKTSSNQSLRPVTIKQLLKATKTHTDADFKIDGTDISQVTFIATIRDITEQSTNVSYMMEDGSGAIEVRKWIETDDTDQQAQKRSGWREGVYVRVIGHLNAYHKRDDQSKRDKRDDQDKRQVIAYHIRLITDYNEITYHHLETLHAHLLSTKGLLPSLAGSSVASNGLDRSAYNPQNTPTDAYASNYTGNQLGGNIMLIIKDHGYGESGLHVAEIFRLLNGQATEEQIRETVDALASEGHLYSTIDDYHYNLTSNEGR